MNRRSILSLFAAAPLAGRAVAESVGESMMNPAVPPSSGWVGAADAAASQGQNAIRQLMEPAAARRLIFSDAKAMAEIATELFESEKANGNPWIDPDIMVLKSLSPMAKITFQRQRNVARALVDLQDEALDRPSRYVRTFQKRLQKLLWGE